MTVTTKKLRGAVISIPKLSWKAKGIALAILLNQEIFADPAVRKKVQILVDMGAEGTSSVQSGLNELKALGILHQTQVRNDTFPNYLRGTIWEIVVDEPTTTA